MSELTIAGKNSLAYRIGAELERALYPKLSAMDIEQGRTVLIYTGIEVHIGNGGTPDLPQFSVEVHLGKDEEGKYAEH